MGVKTWFDALIVANAGAVKLLATRPANGRQFLARSARLYDEMAGHGLAPKDPIVDMNKNGKSLGRAVRLPACLFGPGGTSVEELAVLSAVTSLLQPRKVFEIGTYNGKTTSAFILNSEPGTEIISLDLPNDQAPASSDSNLPSDRGLIATRQLGQCIREMGLEGRYNQVLCNSLEFDSAPHANSVELAFIDGAHELRYVKSDTEKVATMSTNEAMVFWHDYGGKGIFRPLTRYLDSLSRSAPIHRVAGTTLAWAYGRDLKRSVAGTGGK